MAKSLYPSYRAALLDNGVDLITGNVKVAALGAGYGYDDAHNFHNDLTDIIATSSNLTTKTAVDGYFDSDPAALGSPTAGDTITQYVIYRDSGTSATSELVCWSDEDGSASPISWATDGTAKTIIPDAQGWFRP